jgi:hypothetical protein
MRKIFFFSSHAPNPNPLAIRIGFFQFFILVLISTSFKNQTHGFVNDTKNHENKGWKKGLSLTFKQGTKQDYVIQKQKHTKVKNKNTRCAKQT